MRIILSVIRHFDHQPKVVILAVALGSVTGLGLARALANHGAWYETAFVLSYLAPLSFTAWHAGSRWGLIVSVIAVGISLIADASATAAGAGVGHHVWLLYVNGLTRLAAFFLATVLVSTLRLAQNRESGLARTDPLTGLGNLRWFREQLEYEIRRCERYRRPFTLLYGDLDNFKAVNDHLGHAIGDALLREVAQSLQRGVRGVDTVARLGGDEFGILLPETDWAAGDVVAQQLRRGISETMDRRAWPVRASFGVVTCVDPPLSIDAVLSLADELMYAAKREARSGIRHVDLVTGAPSNKGPPATTVPRPMP